MLISSPTPKAELQCNLQSHLRYYWDYWYLRKCRFRAWPSCSVFSPHIPPCHKVSPVQYLLRNSSGAQPAFSWCKVVPGVQPPATPGCHGPSLGTRTSSLRAGPWRLRRSPPAPLREAAGPGGERGEPQPWGAGLAVEAGLCWGESRGGGGGGEAGSSLPGSSAISRRYGKQRQHSHAHHLAYVRQLKL